MKVGYSLTQSEVVAAVELDYGDCAAFQVVCPCCRQPVFKKVRAQPAGDALHFLSHYRADSDEARECELRVAALSQAFLALWTEEGRGQTLARFLGHLRSQLLEAQARAGILPADEARRRAHRVLARTDTGSLFAEMRTLIVRGNRCGVSVEGMADMIGAQGDFQSRSPFWIKRQASYAKDVFDHLLTPQARSNFDFLAALGIVLYHHRMGGHYARSGHDEGPDVLLALGAGKSPGAVRKLLARVAETRNKPDPSRAGAALRSSVPSADAIVAETLPLLSLRKDAPLRAGLLAGVGGASGADAFAMSDFRRKMDAAATLAAMKKGPGILAEAEATGRPVLDVARAHRAEALRQVGDANARINTIGTCLTLIGPMVGALALVPFPDLAAAPPEAVAVA